MLYPTQNPFTQPFERLGDKPHVTTGSVNARELECLVAILTSKDDKRGRLILLRSPRAGFGKTHLLERLRQRVVRTHEFVPLEPIAGAKLDAQCVLDAVIRKFSRVVSAGGGMTILDFLARRIFSVALEPLVKSGDVPSDDPDEAASALRDNPVETFDFHDEEALTAQWAMANFELLQPRLTAELCQRTGGNTRTMSWWVKCLFDYSSTSLDEMDRNKALFEEVVAGGNRLIEVDAHEKLVALIKLISIVTRPVLVLDEVESYFGNPEAALHTSSFLNSLYQSCEKLTVIISTNSDVWETAFQPRLSTGLKDRLTETVIDLKPLSQGQAIQLLHDRAGDYGDQIVEELDLDVGVIYARGLMKESSAIWENMVTSAEEVESESLLEAEPISLVTPSFTNPNELNKNQRVTPKPVSTDVVKRELVDELGAAIAQRESH